MFCPECRMEYINQCTTCPDCNLALVETLEPLDSTEYEFQALVTVFSTASMAELLVAKSLMESAGIIYYAKGDQLADITGRIGFNPAVGAYEIQVRPADVAEAKEILAEMHELN